MSLRHQILHILLLGIKMPENQLLILKTQLSIIAITTLQFILLKNDKFKFRKKDKRLAGIPLIKKRKNLPSFTCLFIRRWFFSIRPKGVRGVLCYNKSFSVKKTKILKRIHIFKFTWIQKNNNKTYVKEYIKCG